MEKKQKGFGSYFGKCFGIMFLIGFLIYMVIPIIKSFAPILHFEISSTVSSIFSVMQFSIPMILVIASVPVSLIYAAVKSEK